MCSLEVNDVLDQLSQENNRLLNELMIAKQIITTLAEFKSFIDLISVQFVHHLDSEVWNKFEQLSQRAKQVVSCHWLTGLVEVHKLTPELVNGGQPSGTTAQESQLKRDNTSESDDSEAKTRSGRTVPTTSYVVASDDDDSTSSDSEAASVAEHKLDTDSASEEEWAEKRPTRGAYKRKFPPIECTSDNCKQIFKRETDLVNHRLLFHSTDPFICSHTDCHFTSRSEDNFRVHCLRRHCDYQPFRCTADGCVQRFEESKDLSAHKSSHNQSRPEGRPVASDSEFKFKCGVEDCGYTTSFSYQLINHRLSHARSKSLTRVRPSGFAFATERLTKRTMNGSKDKSLPAQHKCGQSGCHFVTHSNYFLNKHHQIDHKLAAKNKVLSCKRPGCQYRTLEKAALEGHGLTHAIRDHLANDAIESEANDKRVLRLEQNKEEVKDNVLCDQSEQMKSETEDTPEGVEDSTSAL